MDDTQDLDVTDRAGTRRTGARLAVGAAAVAMILAVVPLALLGRGSPAPADAPPPGDGWRTVELTYPAVAPARGTSRVVVDVPAAWIRADEDCFLDLVATSGGCDEGEGLSVRPDTGNQDLTFEPGLHAAADYGYPVGVAWSGYVTVGPTDGADEAYVDVASEDRQTALRVLGSVRAPGQGIPDVGGAWPVTAQRGVTWSAPTMVDVRARALPENADVYYDGRARKDGGTWRAQQVVDGVLVESSAPSRALAEVVAGSARPDDSGEAVDLWTSRTVEGVTLDVPSGWVRLDTGACRAGALRFGPAGTEPCASPAPLTVASTRSVLLDGTPGLQSGYVLAGDQVVTAEGDPDVVRRVLASAHVPGEDPGDLDGAWEQRSEDGVTWQAPAGGQVQVSLRSGAAVDCAVQPRFAAVPTSDGGWRAGRCGDPVVTVKAPTQALADVVASTVTSTASSEPRDPGEWRTEEVLGVRLDLPPGWERLDTAGCARFLADPARVRFGPDGTDPCALAVPVDVFGPDAIANRRGTLIPPGLYDGVSLVRASDVVVVVRGGQAVKRRVLASARQPGEDPGPLAAPWQQRGAGGLTWLQPPAADLEVEVVAQGCPRTGLARQTGAGWVATYCGSQVATVTASTQALADLVASTVWG